MALIIEHVVPVLRAASNLIPLLPLVYGWRQRPIMWWCALLSICSDASMLLLQSQHLPANWVGNTYFALEFVLISLHYRRRLPAVIPVLPVLPVLFIGFVVYTGVRGINILNLPGAAVLCVVYMIYALADFYGILHQQQHRTLYLEQSRGFWINVAVLFYGAATCLLFLFYQDVLAANPINRQYWAAFFLSMNIFKFGLIATALRAKHA